MNPKIKIDPCEAEILLAHLLGIDRATLLAHPEQPIPFFVRHKLARLIKKRAAGVPLAYLTGHKEFFGLDFVVNRHTLVPRPDTEILVEAAREKIMEKITGQPSHLPTLLIDIGTGSGCIPISIINTLKKTLKSVNIKTIATDISRGALRVARQNAKRHQVAITFLHGNLLNPINHTTIQKFKNIVITANLPYLTAAQFAEEPSIWHEPRTALVADHGGLALYEKLLQQINAWPRPPHTLALFFEIDPSQSERINTLIQHYFPSAKIETIPDLAGQARVVVVSLG